MFNIFKTFLPSGPYPSLKPLPQGLLEKLEASKGVAFALNPKSLILLAANTQGQVLFPDLKAKGAITLDSAMPAMRKIQEMVQNPKPTTYLSHLVFWTARGAQILNCIADRPESPDDDILIIKEEEDRAQVYLRNNSSHRETSSAEHGLRTDRETLDEIARLIRGGQKCFERENSLIPSAIQGSPSFDPTERTSSTLHYPSGNEETLNSLEGLEKKFETGKYPEQIPEDFLILTHELRTPLSAIATVAEVMKDLRLGPIDKDIYRKYLLEIGKSARYALTLLERLGQNSEHQKRKPQKQNLRFERILLNPLISNCLSMITTQQKSKGMTINFRPPYRDYAVLADETSIKQIVLNLLTNALKFTPLGGSIGITINSNKNQDVFLSISDTGRGMTSFEIVEALKSRDPFLNKQEKDSLGLGLPLSTALAEANGAQLSIESRIGKGTKVTVKFPKRELPVI